MGWTGERSVHGHIVYLIFWILQNIAPQLEIVYMGENAGSMREIHKEYWLSMLGLNQYDAHMRSAGEYGHADRKRIFVTNIGCNMTFAVEI